jgi:phospholipase C
LDGGKMDGFVEEMAAFNASAPDTPMGYYNATQVGGYWALAQTFTLCDMYFQPVLGPSLPNRLYAIAGTSDGITTDTWPAGGVTMETIFDQLSAAGIGWRYYYAPGEGLPIPLNIAPLRYTPAEEENVVTFSSLLPDIAAGRLPAVTFIDPEGSDTLSEHPPQNVTVGEAWSLSVIQAIEASPEWNSTVVFLTWDEDGGFYDSVVPPTVDGLGDGFRVPMIVISPFSTGGRIDGTIFDHTSVLKFIEQNWGLPFLNARVAGADSLATALDVSFPVR